MKTQTSINKDDTGSAALLVAMFIMLIAGVLSNPAVATTSAANVSNANVVTVTDYRAPDVKIDTIVVTATRLK